MKTKVQRQQYRKQRVRDRIREIQVVNGRPRLSVHRSLRHFYAQVLDDVNGKTLAYACSLSKELKGKAKSGKNIESAKAVGQLIAAKAVKAGVKKVAFDRGSHIYHGGIKALADAARAAGLEF